MGNDNATAAAANQQQLFNYTFQLRLASRMMGVHHTSAMKNSNKKNRLTVVCAKKGNLEQAR
jgi:hypothetical protein